MNDYVILKMKAKTLLQIEDTVFLDVTQCGLVERYQHFRGTCCPISRVKELFFPLTPLF
jgi:hypothetical protein